MKPGFARDQFGDPWLLVERAGSLWALGFTEDKESADVVIRLIGDDNYIHLDISKPGGIRSLTQVVE